MRSLPPMRAAAVGFGLLALGFGGCAQSPQQMAAASHGKEYFPSSIYGTASRRVVADGQPVPRGGGQYLVGKAYSVAGKTYYPSEHKVVQVGTASWYGDAFHGRKTANGEIYDRDGFTAAHPTMPLPSYARVTNLRNNYSMIVRVNDRGPYASNRVMDVSRRVAESLDFKNSGTAKIKVEYVGQASLAGSDDARLFATLRTNGPAMWKGEPTMVAEAQPSARVASIAPFVPAPHPAVDEEPHPRHVAAIEPPPVRTPHRVQHDPRPLAQDQHEPPRSAHRSTHLASEMPHLPITELMPPPRPGRAASIRTAKAGIPEIKRPPLRPIDLRTIPGADSQIGRGHSVGLRMSHARDD